jgi:hypothetical protein
MSAVINVAIFVGFCWLSFWAGKNWGKPDKED